MKPLSEIIEKVQKTERVSVLRSYLDSGDQESIKLATCCLHLLTPADSSAIISEYFNKVPIEVRVIMTQNIEYTPKPDRLALTRKALEDSDPQVRKAGVFAASELPSALRKELMPIMIKNVEDAFNKGDILALAWLIRTIDIFPDKEKRTYVIRALEHENIAIKRACINLVVTFFSAKLQQDLFPIIAQKGCNRELVMALKEKKKWSNIIDKDDEQLKIKI